MRRVAMAVLAVCLCAACGLSSNIRTEAERTSALIDTENSNIARKEAA